MWIVTKYVEYSLNIKFEYNYNTSELRTEINSHMWDITWTLHLIWKYILYSYKPAIRYPTVFFRNNTTERGKEIFLES